MSARARYEEVIKGAEGFAWLARTQFSPRYDGGDDLYLGTIYEILLEMCCVRVQRCFREFVSTFRAFGPMIFSLKRGQPAPYGTLRFPYGSSGSERQAPFISVSDQTDPKLLALFMKWHWQLSAGSDTDTGSTLKSPPEVLISVMGSAQDFQLTPEVHTVFQKGLVGAANKASAVFFAGGTNSGVISLIGSVFEAGVEVPLVGVAPAFRPSASATYS